MYGGKTRTNYSVGIPASGTQYPWTGTNGKQNGGGAPQATAYKFSSADDYIGDRINMEGNADYPKDDRQYEGTFRFTPPYPFLYNNVAHFAVEFFGTMIFLLSIYGSQALPLSLIQVVACRALSLYVVTYLFWHWGKAHVNPAVTLTSCLLGHSTWWEFIGRFFGQAIGMLAACGIAWGFFKTDGGITLSGYPPNITYGLQWGWEIFFSGITSLGLFLPMCTSRLAWEAKKRWKRDLKEKTKKENSSSAKPWGKQLLERALWSVPEMTGLDHHCSLSYSFLYGTLSLVGGYVTGGAYNIWIWFPHAFNTAASGSELGKEFALYFFAPMIGSLITAGICMIAITCKRRSIVNILDDQSLRTMMGEKDDNAASSEDSDGSLPVGYSYYFSY
jgi:glycerol uptake facilitator-like aquaporin